MTPPAEPISSPAVTPADEQLRAALQAAEQALRESQRQYREIFEFASIGIFRSTPDGQIVLANPALATMLGYDGPEELRALDLGRDVYLRGEERRELVARYEHSHRPWTVEVQWKQRDGTPLWVQISAHAVPDHTGATRYFEAFVQDVTERRSSEEALKQSEARYRALATNLPDASVFLFDHNLRFLLADGTNFKAAGLSKEMLEGQTIWGILPADLCERIAPRFRAALEGEIVRYEEVYNQRTYDVQLLPIRGAGGEIIYGMGVSTDVTTRKGAERALRESDARLRLVSRATNDAVWDWDLVTDAVWWGEGFRTLFGYTAEEIEPGIESWHNRLHPEDRDRVIDRIHSAINEGRTFWVDEYRFRRRDGTYADIYDRGYVIHSADHRPMRMVGSMMDVTDRKRAEAQLRSLAARLEAVREEERTRIAREIHDQLGQALTALKMDLAWLAKKLPPRGAALRSKLRGMEVVIDTTMDAMHRIVAELRPGVLDDLGLPAAIRWLAADFQQRTHIRCSVSVTGSEPALATGQATAVFRILQEALTNVARHAHARHVDIRFHVLPTALELVVADDGRGITPDEAQNRRTLGLLGIRERAATWHGQVTVHGVPGGGTTLRVFMPMAAAAPTAPAAPAA
ncbi:MAG TPA: PAS domain S-box protein [Gemmatimonadales bacterium]|jgi:two-component system sensor histidine kinase UhpB|nr:PAS domain S-box protein [Gemmatimonadales bacterium]